MEACSSQNHFEFPWVDVDPHPQGETAAFDTSEQVSL